MNANDSFIYIKHGVLLGYALYYTSRAALKNSLWM